MTHVQHTMRDGTVVRGTPEMVQLAVDIEARMAGERRSAIDQLRALGVKAAHPDDGWVNREHSTVRLQYPIFNDDPQVGDLIALGRPDDGYRFVRVTALEPGPEEARLRSFYGLRPGEPCWCYSFEPVEPDPQPRQPWWRRLW